MKIELVDANKVKVMLSLSDLVYFNINEENLKPDSPQLHKFLFHVMESVKKETSFNPYSGQVVVEAIHAKDGITLIISKLKQVGEKLTQEQKRKYKNARPVVKNKNENMYRFDSFEDLCAMLRVIGPQALRYSRLYEYEQNFYFILNQGEGFKRSHYILSEYCQQFGAMCAETFLQEHGKLLAAKRNLVAMAEGISGLEKK